MSGWMRPRLECDAFYVIGHDRSCVGHIDADVEIETLRQLREDAFYQGWSYLRRTVDFGDGRGPRTVMVDLCQPCSERLAELRES